MLRKLALHTSNYTLGSLLMTLASLLSFPIFTRIFTVEEYGILNLISAALLLLTGIAKLGIQHSIVRFYGEVTSGKRNIDPAQYYSTTLFGMASVAGIVAVVWAIASQVLPSSWWNDPQVTGLLLLTSVLVIIRTVDSCLSNFLRAAECSGLFSVYSIAKKYVGLAAALFVLYYLARDLYGFYWATIVTEAGAVVVLFVILLRGHSYSPRKFSPSLFRMMLVFGVPMIGFELAGATLNIGDRYVIQAMLGSAPLGVYSAGYNLCGYVQIILMSSIGQAIIPMYVRIWEEKGEVETRRFIRQALHFYLMLVLPVIVGLAVVSPDLLVFLASEKYRESATIIPYVVAGMAIDGMVVIVGAGLYIYKRTMVIAGLVGACAVLNVLLNILLIPHWGIVGSAVATLISYASLGLSVLCVSERKMPIAFPWISAVKFCGMAVIMYFTVIQLHTGNTLVTLISKILIGMLVYSALVMVFDVRARTAVLKCFLTFLIKLSMHE